MCGIFGYVNYGVVRSRREILETLLTGLTRLEYRGYDSAGLAVDGVDSPIAHVFRAVGTVTALTDDVAPAKASPTGDHKYSTHVGIAHTRWATHGRPSVINAHPHVSDPEHAFVVVHNGIITNYRPLKEMLAAKGSQFVSETDTEVVAHLLLYLYHSVREHNRHPTFPRLVTHLMGALEGAFSLVIRSSFYPHQIVACKRGSPLVVGIRGSGHAFASDAVIRVTPMKLAPAEARVMGAKGQHGDVQSPRARVRRLEFGPGMALQGGGVGDGGMRVEYFFSSDASAIVEHTDKVVFTEDNDLLHVCDGRLEMWQVGGDDHAAVVEQSRDISKLTFELEQIMKGNYPHFMLKEIFEQPDTVGQTMRGRLKRRTDNGFDVMLSGIHMFREDFRRSTRMIFVACGTSYHSCLAARQVVEELTELPVTVELASDFLDRQCPIFRSDVCVFVSQSGETAETLEALRYAKSNRALTVGVVNVVGSAIARLTDCGVHLNAGCEIGVASTKVYTSQIVAIVMAALQLSDDSKQKEDRRQEICRALEKLPEKIASTLKQTDARMKQLAEQYAADSSILLFGRGFHYATCLEGALKIKEVSYMHTEGIHAGELKHGPLALVDEKMPIILFVGADGSARRVRNALHQVMARGPRDGSRLLVVCVEDDEETLDVVREGSQTGRIGVLRLPRTVDCLQSVLHIIPMQLLSYHLAVHRGHNVDQPRHLAKSVTTE